MNIFVRTDGEDKEDARRFRSTHSLMKSVISDQANTRLGMHVLREADDLKWGDRGQKLQAHRQALKPFLSRAIEKALCLHGEPGECIELTDDVISFCTVLRTVIDPFDRVTLLQHLNASRERNKTFLTVQRDSIHGTWSPLKIEQESVDSENGH